MKELRFWQEKKVSKEITLKIHKVDLRFLNSAPQLIARNTHTKFGVIVI